MYLYKAHLGGFYTSEIELDYESLYCYICNDSDVSYGYYETSNELWELIKDEVNINHSGGYALSYVATLFLDGQESDYLNMNDDAILEMIKKKLLKN